MFELKALYDYTTMADCSFLISSSSFPPNPSPKIPNSKPLLSNVRRDLTFTANPHANPNSNPISTRRLLKYYASLASKLAANGKLTDFLMIAESVLTSDAVKSENPQFIARVDTRMVTRGVKEVLMMGKLEEVLEFLKKGDELGICAASLVDEDGIRVLGEKLGRRFLVSGRLVEFVELMETLAGYGFSLKNIVDPVDVLKLFVERADPDLAVRYADIFPHSQLLFCNVIEEFGKKRDMSSAMRTYEACKAKSGGFSMFACRCIIDVCGLCGDFSKSRSIFEELLAQNIVPNIYVFNSLMNVNTHDLSYTFQVYKHAQNLGVSMDLTSYNILLKACSIARRVDLAQDIYNETKQLEANGDLRLDVFTYSTMIKVFADAKMWTMALSIKDDMLSAGVVPNTVTWSSLISACAKTGLLDHAVQIFDEMLVSGCKPNTQCCNILLDACVKSCQFDRAFRLYHTWKSAGIKIFDMTKGRSEVVPFTPTVATFNILMKACGTDLYRPKYLMDEMKTFGLSPNGISWSVLVGLYGTSQNTKGAIEATTCGWLNYGFDVTHINQNAFRTMQGLGIKLDVIAYTTAIKVCVGNNNLKVAFSLFEEMKRCSVKPDLVTYNTLLRARRNYGSLHEIQQCLTVYQDMRNAGYDANDCHLKELIEEWCEGVIRSTKEYTLSGIRKMQKFDRSKNPNGVLLEKIAAHLRKDSDDNHVIDIRGLSQIESRIVVLSVLWKIRESYRTARKVVQQDMIIMSGVGKGSESNDLEVHLAIIKVLKDDLRLDVATGYGKPIQTIELSADRDDYKQIARRPEDLGVIKVSSKSLCNWLQRKEGQ